MTTSEGLEEGTKLHHGGKKSRFSTIGGQNGNSIHTHPFLTMNTSLDSSFITMNEYINGNCASCTYHIIIVLFVNFGNLQAFLEEIFVCRGGQTSELGGKMW